MRCDASFAPISSLKHALACIRAFAVLLVMFIGVVGVLSGQPQRASSQSKTAIGSTGGVSVEADAARYSEWTEVKGARVTINAGVRPILLAMIPLPGLVDKPYRIRLDNNKAGIANRWEIRYLRDSKNVIAVFAIGQTAPSNALNTEVPLSLTALDAPPSGTHIYTLQIRYVGPKVEGDGPKLEIMNARISANAM